MRLLLAITLLTFNTSLTAQTKFKAFREYEQDTIQGMKVLAIVEQPPEYEGGTGQFYRDLSQNLKFPKLDSTYYLNKRYFISFVIDTSGAIQNFCATVKMNELTDDEILENINKWTPGIHRGRKVPVRMMLPVTIRME